jgi:hypothetical protein
VQDIDYHQRSYNHNGKYDYDNPEDALPWEEPFEGKRTVTRKTEFAVFAGLRVARADATAVWAGLREHSVRHCREIAYFAGKSK